jgi:hypothetical protein
MVLFRDLTPGWFDQHSPYRDPPEPPEFYTVEVRRVTDADGVLLVVYRDQDGETFVMDADEYDNGPMP